MVISNILKDWILSSSDSYSKVIGVNVLKGSTTAKMLHIHLLLNSGRTENLVLRQYEHDDFTSEDILHEKEALQKAVSLSIAAPKVINIGLDKEKTGGLKLLMTALDGAVNISQGNNHIWIEKLAETLSKLHDNQNNQFNWHYERYQYPESIIIPSWTSVPEVWQSLKNIAQLPEPEYTKVFIHRDYHPVNVLWKDKNVSGVVDWVNACIGPRGVDVGHCRWNLAMLEGVRQADIFLDYYKMSASDSFEYNVYWDIVSLMDVVEESISVYPGWRAFGRIDITKRRMIKRMDEYALSLFTRYNN